MMKFLFLAVAAISQANNALAFPAIADEIANAGLKASLSDKAAAFVKRQIIPPGFNARLQRVSVTGEHRFVAPNFANGDVRGPCPGLNAMANHGYLPRNGVGSHTDFIQGTFDVFGMGLDLSGFLTVLGGVLDGDGLRWSIGGPHKSMRGLLGLLGTPQGISGSHNKYETDVSPTRGDLYKFGDGFSLQMPQWKQLYRMGQRNGNNYTLEVLNEFRSKRFDNSVATNPYFFHGPFTGVLVSPAAFQFIYRFMGNKSEEHPEGYLNGDVLMSFFSIRKNKQGKHVHTPGHERIPNNWYKRAIGDEYTIPFFLTDTIAAAQQYPKFLTIGGNTGKVNTLIGVDPEDVSGGLFNSQNLLEGNNLSCFSMYFAAQAAPDLIRCSKVLSDITGAVSQLNSQLAKSLAGMNCPPVGEFDETQFEQFPGYTELKCRTGKY